MNWSKRNPTRLNPEDLTKKADDSLRKTKNQQPWVNYLNRWLTDRKDRNGFGDDIEITLIPKGV